ncbi:hypothetical protein RJT34_17754 [Clitoria ternatea]|uniref:Uncharacterized protein n=1 Tax=Clitoria ternatea TaxID=43366 RepID=A0AAN9PF58_CLITE
MECFARSLRAWRRHCLFLSFFPNPNFSLLAPLSSPSYSKFVFTQSTTSVPDVSSSRVLREDYYSLLPLVLAGHFGIGLAETTYVDNAAGNVDVQDRVRKERKRIEELLRSRGIQYGSYPRFTVAAKGQKVIPWLAYTIVYTLR